MNTEEYNKKWQKIRHWIASWLPWETSAAAKLFFFFFFGFGVSASASSASGSGSAAGASSSTFLCVTNIINKDLRLQNFYCQHFSGEMNSWHLHKPCETCNCSVTCEKVIDILSISESVLHASYLHVKFGAVCPQAITRPLLPCPLSLSITKYYWALWDKSLHITSYKYTRHITVVAHSLWLILSLEQPKLWICQPELVILLSTTT